MFSCTHFVFVVVAYQLVFAKDKGSVLWLYGIVKKIYANFDASVYAKRCFIYDCKQPNPFYNWCRDFMVLLVCSSRR